MRAVAFFGSLAFEALRAKSNAIMIFEIAVWRVHNLNQSCLRILHICITFGARAQTEKGHGVERVGGQEKSERMKGIVRERSRR